MSKHSIKKVRHYNTELSAKEKVLARKSCPPQYPHRQAALLASNAETDAMELPPNDWQPTEVHLEQMRNEPPLDLDAHLGNEQDERNGLRWLNEQAADVMEVSDDELIIAPSEAEFFGQTE